MKNHLYCLHPFHLISVLNPEHFWCKLSSTSLSQSQESNVLSHAECKIAKNSQGFAPGPRWGGLTAPPQTPWLHKGFSTSYACRKTSTPQKLLDMALYFSNFFKPPPTLFALCLLWMNVYHATFNVLFYLMICKPWYLSIRSTLL